MTYDEWKTTDPADRHLTPDNLDDDDPECDPMPRVSYEIHQHGHSVLLRWKSRTPTRGDVRQMAEILRHEANRLDEEAERMESTKSTMAGVTMYGASDGRLYRVNDYGMWEHADDEPA
jgi:hypothetical protein